MQVNQKTDPSSTNEIQHSPFTIHDLRYLGFTVHDSRYTIYDIRFKIYSSSITHTHILLIFKNNPRKSAQTIRENQRETKKKESVRNKKEKHSARNPKE